VTGPALPPLPVSRLLIWRHGRTEWNAEGRFQGQLDPPLDAEGRSQAVRAAAQLVVAGLSAEDTVVVSSDLRRAVVTATALTDLTGLPLLQDARLREHGMGCWEGLTRDEVAARYPDQYADWRAGRPVRGRGGEEPEHVADRALAALVDLPSARTAVVVTHGGTAGRLMERLLGVDAQHRRIFGPLANCAWSELRTESDHWRLLRHNASVLPPPGESGASRRPVLARDAPAAASSDATAAEPDAASTEDADAVL
jgi:glucosyl-3-phosphoglycerate phosphatase